MFGTYPPPPPHTRAHECTHVQTHTHSHSRAQVAVAILIPSEVLASCLLPEALPQWGIWGTAVIPFQVSTPTDTPSHGCRCG